MVFSSLFFLFGFLPVFLFAYFLAPDRWRNFVVLIASGFFYAWGAPQFILIVFATSWFDYVASVRIGRTENHRIRMRWMWGSIALNLTLLIYFKYANFFVAELNQILSAYGAERIRWVRIALPIGISFITFEKISYIVDVFTGRVRPAPNFRTYLLFLALFPHLIAGPIFRYHDISEQLVARTITFEDLFIGMQRFVLGLSKKVLLADPMSEVVHRVYALPFDSVSPAYAWLGALAYAFQIFFDFSGYSDMAIGLGRMMGFRFLENFNQPYISENITDFWRRWHISLSNWMREYLYIPLGGSRGSPVRTYVNLWIVFLLSGLWHGANWTFLFWGFYHGLFLILDRLFLLRALAAIPRFVRILATFFVVVLGWVPFRSESLHEAWQYWGRMVGLTWNENPAPLITEILHNRAAFVFVLCAFFTFVPAIGLRRSERAHTPAIAALAGALALCLFFLSTLALVNSQFHPFIYFRF